MSIRHRALSTLNAAAVAAALAAGLAVAAASPAAAQLSSGSSLGSSQALSSAGIANEVRGSSNSVSGAISTPDAERHTLRVGGRDREYLLILPRNYDPVRTYPAIIGFGGWHHKATDMRGYADLERSAGSDAIVVYAEGVDNAWGGAPYATTTLREDIDFVEALIDELVSDYSARRSEIFATGFSNGGGMAAALACHAPELVAGVSTVAGAHYDPTVTGCAAGQVPALIVHGTQDGVINYTGGTRHGAPYFSVDETFTALGQKNGCDMSRLTYVDDGELTIFTPRDCDVDTRVVRVNGGAHSWFADLGTTQRSFDFFEGV